MKKTAVLFLLILLPLCVFSQENGIINNSGSPYVVFKSIDIGDCVWTDGFWANRFNVCAETMMPHMESILTGDIGHALNNFKIAASIIEGEHQGTNWHDGDFYKWMESAMYVYAQTGDEDIRKRLDDYIEIIGKAQMENGYLQTRTMIDGLDPFSNRQHHEMYNSGHLMTSACIHQRITGKTNFLEIAVRNADLLYETFHSRPEELSRFGYNQTQIMGLVEMYRTTGERKYLELAEIFINMRGRQTSLHSTVSYRSMGDHTQERTPLRKESEAVGHAVLALYFYAGAADVYSETGEKALIEALDRLWSNVVHKKMYVTGACGQAHHGASSHTDLVHEAFIDEYMLPNMTAYNETCANISNAMFSYRMLGIHGEAKYADIIELVLYNSALSGISIEGKDYFYTNPLRKIHNSLDYASTESANRESYINCFCCPPNLVRTIAKISGWAYSLTDNGLAVNLYGGNKLETEMLDGSVLRLKQMTDYPWNGKVIITIEECRKQAFDIHLRIPEWAEGTLVRINGEEIPEDIQAGEYAAVNREWKKGDVISLEMPMEIKLIEGHPRIEEVRNQLAIKRGPVVYCIESPDLPEGTDILDVYLPMDGELIFEHRSDFLGGLSIISGDVMLRQDEGNGMYREIKRPEWKRYRSQFIPYYAWSNRGTAEMTVWIPVIWN